MASQGQGSRQQKRQVAPGEQAQVEENREEQKIVKHSLRLEAPTAPNVSGAAG